jgi:hypothetical protein
MLFSVHIQTFHSGVHNRTNECYSCIGNPRLTSHSSSCFTGKQPPTHQAPHTQHRNSRLPLVLG